MTRQWLRSPSDLIRAFAPYGLQPLAVRPVVLRPPIFSGGFHEIPLIPDALAGPPLKASKALFRVTSHFPRTLAALPLVLTESYSITFRKPG